MGADEVLTGIDVLKRAVGVGLVLISVFTGLSAVFGDPHPRGLLTESLVTLALVVAATLLFGGPGKLTWSYENPREEWGRYLNPRLRYGLGAGSVLLLVTLAGLVGLGRAATYGVISAKEAARRRVWELPLELGSAARQGDLARVRELVGQGADVNADDGNGVAPLVYAASGGHLATVKYLVAQGANVSDGAASCAVDAGHLDVVTYLVEQGADVNAAADSGRALLHVAVDHLAVVRYLVEQGADVNVATVGGWTPLHEAVQRGHRDVVRYLVEQGADVNAVDMKGQTPLQLARSEEVRDLLRQRGATEPAVGSGG